MLSIASKIVSVRQIDNEIQVRLLKDHFFINTFMKVVIHPGSRINRDIR